MLDTRVKDKFTFDGSANDYYNKATIDNLNQLLYSYADYAKEDMAPYEELLKGDPYEKAIGNGSWLRIIDEKTYQWTYTYKLKQPYGISTPEDSWVDGRYISKYGCFEKGAKFEDYKTADIVLTNQTVTDYYGVKHDGIGILYSYNDKYDVWVAYQAINYYYRSSFKDPESTPDDMLLTQDEVSKMSLDYNTNTDPEHGLIYDGSTEPGTAF